MKGSSPRILVLGYSAFDVTVPFSGTPRNDGKHQVPAITLGGGGPGATAAVAMARLGGRVRLITPLTEDLPGRLQQNELNAAGVDLSLSPHFVDGRSAQAVILVDGQRMERTIFWSRGDLPQLDPEVMDPDWLDETDLFYTDGHENPGALVLAKEARRRGMPVVLDAGSVRPAADQLVELCTDVISSEVFAPALTGCADPVEALIELARRGPVRVAMTFGGGGLLALVGGKPVAVPAFDLPVVDTTGAGDAFHAGYAFGLALRWDFLGCLRLGAAVAGLKCRRWGGRPGLPEMPEALAVLEQAPLRPLDPRIASFAGR